MADEEPYEYESRFSNHSFVDPCAVRPCKRCSSLTLKGCIHDSCNEAFGWLHADLESTEAERDDLVADLAKARAESKAAQQAQKEATAALQEKEAETKEQRDDWEEMNRALAPKTRGTKRVFAHVHWKKSVEAYVIPLNADTPLCEVIKDAETYDSERKRRKPRNWSLLEARMHTEDGPIMDVADKDAADFIPEHNDTLHIVPIVED